MPGKFVKRMIVGLALMMGLTASLISGSTLASASPAAPAANRFGIEIGGAFAEYLDGYNASNPMVVTRGSDRSAIFNRWISTTFNQTVVIDEYLFNGESRIAYYGAHVIRVVNSPNGSEQTVTIAYGATRVLCFGNC